VILIVLRLYAYPDVAKSITTRLIACVLDLPKPSFGLCLLQGAVDVGEKHLLFLPGMRKDGIAWNIVSKIFLQSKSLHVEKSHRDVVRVVGIRRTTKDVVKVDEGEEPMKMQLRITTQVACAGSNA
jgi:hypothetical protein